MTTAKALINSAIAGVLALGGVAGTTAADHSKDEKCAGMVKAGMNDCTTSTNACGKQVQVDSHPEAWIWVPKGTCAKIAGGARHGCKNPGRHVAAIAGPIQTQQITPDPINAAVGCTRFCSVC